MPAPAMRIPKCFKGQAVGWVHGELRQMQRPANDRHVSWPRKEIPIISWPRVRGGREYDWCFPWGVAIVSEPAEQFIEPKRWTADEVRQWLSDAMRTLRYMPANGVFPADYRSCMPTIVRSFFDAYENNSEPSKDVATRDDIARMDMVMIWLTWLPYRRDVVVVTGCAIGVSLRRVARVAHKSHVWVRARNRQCLELIANRLNAVSGPTH